MLWWGHHGDTIEQPASSPAHHWRNPNWSPTFPNIASGRKALTFTWLIFPKTMSDNQRVSGWSVLCFRTPTGRCIKPRTAGAFLFFPSDSPLTSPRKNRLRIFLNIGSGAFSLKSQAESFKVGLVLPLESNMKAARKPQKMVATVVMAKYPTRDL